MSKRRRTRPMEVDGNALKIIPGINTFKKEASIPLSGCVKTGMLLSACIGGKLYIPKCISDKSNANIHSFYFEGHVVYDLKDGKLTDTTNGEYMVKITEERSCASWPGKENHKIVYHDMMKHEFHEFDTETGKFSGFVCTDMFMDLSNRWLGVTDCCIINRKNEMVYIKVDTNRKKIIPRLLSLNTRRVEKYLPPIECDYEYSARCMCLLQNSKGCYLIAMAASQMIVCNEDFQYLFKFHAIQVDPFVFDTGRLVVCMALDSFDNVYIQTFKNDHMICMHRADGEFVKMLSRETGRLSSVIEYFDNGVYKVCTDPEERCIDIFKSSPLFE